jgi:hypothetical protein
VLYNLESCNNTNLLQKKENLILSISWALIRYTNGYSRKQSYFSRIDSDTKIEKKGVFFRASILQIRRFRNL